MEADRIITTTKKIDLDIQEITLLSIEETKEYLTREQLATGSWWWLRSPGFGPFRAAYVDNDGRVSTDGISVDFSHYGVRPALRISSLGSLDLSIGDKIKVGGENWTVISDDLALCENVVGNSCFRYAYTAPDANVYEKSDVKIWLDQWALERGIVTQENIALFQTR